MTLQKKDLFKYVIFCALIFVISIFLGVVFNDLSIIGTITLCLGCSQIFFMSKGIWWQELLGIAENLFTAIICINAQLYGTVIFTLIIFIPISIFTLLNWKNNQTDGTIYINKMSSKGVITILGLLLLAIAVVAIVFAHLPGQNLPLLDSISNLFDLTAVLLFAFRYKEGWFFWMLCSITSIVMWVLLYINININGAIMMIILSILYLIMYVWGYLSFIKIHKIQGTLKRAY